MEELGRGPCAYGWVSWVPRYEPWERRLVIRVPELLLLVTIPTGIVAEGH